MWTIEQRRILDGIEADLIMRGVSEKKARMMAERQLEQLISRDRDQ
jgi:hypothetical protein